MGAGIPLSEMRMPVGVFASTNLPGPSHIGPLFLPSHTWPRAWRGTQASHTDPNLAYLGLGGRDASPSFLVQRCPWVGMALPCGL